MKFIILMFTLTVNIISSCAYADLKGSMMLCHGGDGMSCLLAGRHYEQSLNDIYKALEFYHKGCSIGYGEACLEEALIYCSGRGELKADELKGYNLITKACVMMNEPKSCYSLAQMHMDGRCLAKRNKASARYYLKKACAYGDERGCSEDMLK